VELAFFMRRRRSSFSQPDKGKTMTTYKNTQTHPTGGTSSISDETALKVAKEITVKFIEVGSITPTNFATAFANIYQTIRNLISDTKS
jgi:hypothetical protein